MGLINYAIKGNLKKFLNNLDKISSKTGKSKTKLFMKFLNCFFLTGCGYSDFLNYELYNKKNKEVKEYATIKDQDKFYEIASPSKYKTFFTIKPEFLKNFKKYINRDFFYNGSKKDLEKFLKNNQEFMIKPIDGLGGSGVEKLTTKNIQDQNEFYEKLKNENLFLEGYVNQHKEMNKLCPSSCNTLRIMTLGLNGQSEILYATLRIGDGHHAVDNFHKGGMALLVDLDTGKLIGKALDKDLNEYEEHPLTKIKFDGFQIPNWEKVKKTVLEAALVNEHIHVVGWDVAITEEGCTFIEGNRRPGFDIVQVTSRKGRKDIMRHVLNKINEVENTNYKI